MTEPIDHLDAARFWLGVGPHGDGQPDPLPAIAHALIAIAERLPARIVVNAVPPRDLLR